MKNILCFGDSNTWGGCQEGGKIIRFNARWTKLLAEKLGKNFNVIEEGLNGRTIDSHRPNKSSLVGYNHLELLLETHIPVDLVIIMLGTNDLFSYFSNSAKQVGEMLDKVISKIKTHKYSVGTCPEILVIAPPKINAKSVVKVFDVDEFSEAKSIELEKEYKDIAKKNFCLYVSALDLKVGNDGLHLTVDSHKKLADKIYSRIKGIYDYEKEK